MAIGDQYNDLEMISEVGHGVAMPSAPAAVQAAAQYVAPPVGEEGAAQMIERIALDGWRAPAGALARIGARWRRQASLGERSGGAAVTLAAGTGAARLLPDDAAGRAEAVEVLRAGGLVAMPTDTVYGVGVALDAPDGLARLFAAKDRPLDRAIVLLVADLEQAAAVGVLSPAARAAGRAVLAGRADAGSAQAPGARLPAVLTAGAATIGVRLPDHDCPRALARALGPLPVTSANISGQPDARDAAEVAGPARRAHRPGPGRRPGRGGVAVDGRGLHGSCRGSCGRVQSPRNRCVLDEAGALPTAVGPGAQLRAVARRLRTVLPRRHRQRSARPRPMGDALTDQRQ